MIPTIWAKIKGSKGNTDEPDTTDNKSTLKRRSVLSALGTTGVAAATLGAIPQASATETDSKPLTGKERKAAIASALKSEEVHALFSNYPEIGRKRVNESTTVTAKIDSEWVNIVRIPFSVNRGYLSLKEEATIEDPYILWSDSDEVDAFAAYLIRKDNEDNPRAVNHFSSTTGENKTVIMDEVGNIRQANKSDVSPQFITGVCPFGQYLHLGCLERTVNKNRSLTQGCSMCAAALASGANIASVAACGWCAYDLVTKDAKRPCDLCRPI